MKALDNEDKYVENTNFKGWVFTIMRNLFINNYRAAVRASVVVDRTDDLDIESLVALDSQGHAALFAGSAAKRAPLERLRRREKPSTRLRERQPGRCAEVRRCRNGWRRRGDVFHISR